MHIKSSLKVTKTLDHTSDHATSIEQWQQLLNDPALLTALAKGKTRVEEDILGRALAREWTWVTADSNMVGRREGRPVFTENRPQQVREAGVFRIHSRNKRIRRCRARAKQNLSSDCTKNGTERPLVATLRTHQRYPTAPGCTQPYPRPLHWPHA